MPAVFMELSLGCHSKIYIPNKCKEMQKTRLRYDEEEMFRKKLIALLLSGADTPITSKVNFQKELCLLIRAMPQYESIFDFIPHRLGPYSNSAKHIVENNP